MTRDQLYNRLEREMAKLESLAYALDSFNDKPGWYARQSVRAAIVNLEDARLAWTTGQKVRRDVNPTL